MSDTIDQAVSALNAKMDGDGFDGTAKFVIEGEGSIMLDGDGARAGDEEADVTMTADTETFAEIHRLWFPVDSIVRRCFNLNAKASCLICWIHLVTKILVKIHSVP